MFGLILVSPLLILLAIVSYAAIVHGIPFFNSLFARFVWEDPADRQSRIVLKRLTRT